MARDLLKGPALRMLHGDLPQLTLPKQENGTVTDVAHMVLLVIEHQHGSGGTHPPAVVRFHGITDHRVGLHADPLHQVGRGPGPVPFPPQSVRSLGCQIGGPLTGGIAPHAVKYAKQRRIVQLEPFLMGINAPVRCRHKFAVIIEIVLVLFPHSSCIAQHCCLKPHMITS